MKSKDSPRILIFNVNWLGDVLFSTPFIRAIRKKYPDSFIACAIPPRCREILELNPYIDEIIIYDEIGAHSSMWGRLRFISELKKRRFEIAFLLHRSFTRSLLIYLAGIKNRIGYHEKKRPILLTKIITAPDSMVHKIDYFLNVAKEIGISDYTREYDFFIGDEHEKKVKSLLSLKGIKEGDRFVVINPGGNWDPKRWPKENFAKLADRLIADYNIKVVISGAKKDKKLAEEIEALMQKDVINLCGETDLKQLGALLKRANLVVSSDTGPMHIAVSVNAPTIALFGPTSPELTGPCGRGQFSVIRKAEECSVPCYDLSCTDNSCMRLINVDDVMVEAGKLL